MALRQNAKKAEEYLDFFDSDDVDGSTKKRTDNYTTMVNHYYDLVTDFYELVSARSRTVMCVCHHAGSVMSSAGRALYFCPVVQECILLALSSLCADGGSLFPSRRPFPLTTCICRYGWGQCFHFAPRDEGQSFQDSLLRHEHFMADHLHVGPGSRILDVGCGVGGPMRNIARHTGAKVCVLVSQTRCTSATRAIQRN